MVQNNQEKKLLKEETENHIVAQNIYTQFKYQNK